MQRLVLFAGYPLATNSLEYVSSFKRVTSAKYFLFSPLISDGTRPIIDGLFREIEYPEVGKGKVKAGVAVEI